MKTERLGITQVTSSLACHVTVNVYVAALCRRFLLIRICLQKASAVMT